MSNPNTSEARGLSGRPLDPLVLRFLSQLAHELRTPLTGIKGSIGVVLANEPNGVTDAHRRMFQTIDAAADRMEHMIGNLSELVRMQSGQFELYREPCDLVEICEHVIELAGIDGQLRGREVELTAPREGVLATADRARVERVLRNLIVGAAKLLGTDGLVAVTFDTEGQDPVVCIAAEHASPPDGAEPLVPLDRAASEERINLELAVASAIIDRHGGDVAVSSTPQGGILLRVRLPRDAPDDANETDDPASGGPEAVGHKTARQEGER